MEQINELWATVYEQLATYGLNVIGALGILIAGWVVANWLSKRVKKSTAKTERIDDTISPILVKGTKIAVLIITILAVLNRFGVQTASIIAVLGAIGLAIGLALQGTLSNIASGFMLLLLRPFNVGDAVEIGGTSGIVDEIGLFVTEMHSFNNVAITMPNSQIWGTKIENLTRNETRRVDMEVGIGYDDDIDKAMKVIKEVLDGDDRVLSEPAPLIAVGSLGDNAVILRVRPWTATENYWPLYHDFTKKVKQRFDEEDISFPYPQRDVHLFQEG
ncbi:mechanosensitive ion channel family protein [Aliifodinibius sp. S!AR15-10]|uniref:mechanosensitive ion channel family protein n=1 Tax=Aliifodinibius sp. S!AR15-10 TaxID=2950437 RepID=UPI0028651056|nr:mechanosensitive ion channel family protein [Aliifodinibius sp. S!AR15-10]MDR8392678.1 mechanosensitive ion channel family protein [Aliifodinibius sp. S!AR15-10]